MGSVNFGICVIGALLIERLGRRLLLLISIVGLTACTTALGIFFFLLDQDPTVAERLGWLPLTSLSVFYIAFSLGYGPVVWVMVGKFPYLFLKKIIVIKISFANSQVRFTQRNFRPL